MKNPSVKLSVQPLEPRAVPALITVIVGEASAGGATAPPAWADDLARAIGRADSGGQTDADPTVVSLDGTRGAVAVAAGGSDVVLLNWTPADAGTAAVEAVGTRLADYVRTLLPADGRTDLHFIGFDLGAWVNVAAVRGLAADDARVGKLQMTALDAQAPDPAAGDSPATGLPTPYNVDYADDYYQTGDRAGLPFATANVGTQVDVTAALAAWPGRAGAGADHAEVHDWYHWTADRTLPTTTPAGEDFPAPAVSYRDPGLAAEFAPTTRPALYTQALDLNADGTPDDLQRGAAVGFNESIRDLTADPPADPTGLDLVFVIDTTGSMGDDIAGVQAKAEEMLQNVRQTVPDARIAVVLYKDAGDVYRTQTLVPFTTDFDATDAAIQGITVAGGGDTPESVFSGLDTAVSAVGDFTPWRGDGVRRSIVLMGDARGHFREDGTNFTLTSTALRAKAAGVAVSTVASNPDADAYWMFKAVADLTGGTFYSTAAAPPPGVDWSAGGEWAGIVGGPVVSPPMMSWDGGLFWPIAVADDSVAGVGYGLPAVSSPPSVAPDGDLSAAAGDSSAAAGAVFSKAVDDIVAGFRHPTDLPPDAGGGGSAPNDPPTSTPEGPSATNDPPVTAVSPPPAVPPGVAVGSPAGQPASVSVVNVTTGIATNVPTFDAAFTGGVRTATADVTGDGVADVVMATGPGGSGEVRVVDGRTGAELFRVRPFEASFTGGLNVAAGDVTGDGVPDLLVTAGAGGGPRLQAYDGHTFALAADRFVLADADFRGGVTVAVGDLNGDGVPDLLVAAGEGGGPQIAGYDGRNWTARPTPLFPDFFAFESEFRGGATVAFADADGDGTPDVVVGAGPTGGPRVAVFSTASVLAGAPAAVGSFLAGTPGDRAGVQVGALPAGGLSVRTSRGVELVHSPTADGAWDTTELLGTPVD